MTKVLVLYYSSYGHIEKMAYAIAEGAREAGATVDVKRVPETVPEEIAKASYFKLDQPAPIATPASKGTSTAPSLKYRRPSPIGGILESHSLPFTRSSD